MNEKNIKIIDRARKFLDVLRNLQERPLRLDFSDESLGVVMMFLTSLEKSKDSLNNQYVNDAMIGMAVYLGDYLANQPSYDVFRLEFTEDGALKEIVFVTKSEEGAVINTNLLTQVRKAMKKPEENDLTIKMPAIKATHYNIS